MTSASVAFAPLCPPTSPVFLPAASRRTPLLCRRRSGHLPLRPWIRGCRPAIFLHPSHRMTKPGCCCFPPVLQCGVYTCRHKEQKNENTKRKVAQLKEFLHWQSSGGKRSLPPANECLSVACLVHPSVVATSGGAPPVKPWQTSRPTLTLPSPPLLRCAQLFLASTVLALHRRRRTSCGCGARGSSHTHHPWGLTSHPAGT